MLALGVTHECDGPRTSLSGVLPPSGHDSDFRKFGMPLGFAPLGYLDRWLMDSVHQLMAHTGKLTDAQRPVPC